MDESGESMKNRTMLNERMIVLLIKRFVLSAIAALALTGCAGTPFSWDSARQIQPGMSIEEVTNLVGPPLSVTAAAGRMTYVWSYAQAYSGSRTLAVVFVDGKVTEAPPIPPSFK